MLCPVATELVSDRDGFLDRIGFAFLALQQRERPNGVTQEQLAARVGRRIGKTLTQAASQGWLTGSIPRDLTTMTALADELGVDAGWLYFDRGNAPAGWTPRFESPPADPRKAKPTGSTKVDRTAKKQPTRKTG